MKTTTFLLLLITSSLFGQLTKDSERLSKMDYMQTGVKINCDSTTGSNLEHKICLNIQFQKADSILNLTYLKALKKLDEDSLKNQLKTIQISWVKHRHKQAILASLNSQGHLLGIHYLNYMLIATSNRTTELETISLN